MSLSPKVSMAGALHPASSLDNGQAKARGAVRPRVHPHRPLSAVVHMEVLCVRARDADPDRVALLGHISPLFVSPSPRSTSIPSAVLH